MNKKEQQAQRAKQEDAVLNKVLWWIVGTVVLEALLLLLNKVYTNYTPDQIPLALALRTVFKVLAVVLPICFVGLLAWAVKAHKSGKHAGLSAALATVAFVLAACAVAICLFDASGISFLYVAVPVAAVLAMVYYLYQREFFFIGVLSALGLLGVKVIPYKTSFSMIGYAYLAVLAVILLAAVILFRMLQSKGGFLKVKGADLEVLPKNTVYAMLYVTCALVALVAIAALLLGAVAMLYGVLVAWLLIMAVYYTVRLM